MQIQVEGVGLVEFPDDATQDEISTALNESYPTTSVGNLGSVLGQPATRLPFISGMPYGIAPTTDNLGVIPTPELAREQLASEQSSLWKQPLEERKIGVPSTAGITPEIVPSGRRLTEMVTGAPPELAAALRQEVPLMKALDVPATVASSVAKTGIGLAEYLSSPQGITELVVSRTPAKLLVLGKWALDMAKGTYEQGKQLGALLNKPDKTPEDWQAISDHTINAVAMALGTIGAGKGAVTEVKSLASKLQMPAGKIPLQDRGDVIRNMEDAVQAERLAREGSPFVRATAPPETIPQGFRTVPPIGAEPTFEPSGLKTAGPVQPPPEGAAQPLQPPAPTMAPPYSSGLAARAVRLQGEAAQRLADWEKAMAEKVAQEQTQLQHPDKPLTENQLRIMRESIVRELTAKNPLTQIRAESGKAKTVVGTIASPIEIAAPAMSKPVKVVTKPLPPTFQQPFGAEHYQSIVSNVRRLGIQGTEVSEGIFHDSLGRKGKTPTPYVRVEFTEGSGQAPLTAKFTTMAEAERFMEYIDAIDREGKQLSGLEAWADNVFKNAQEQNLRFSGGDSKMMAAAIIKGTALLNRGVTSMAAWTEAMMREHPELRNALSQIRAESEKVRAAAFQQKGGVDRGLQEKGKEAEVTPAAPVTEATKRDWDLFYEDLVGNLDSFAPARETGRTSYELNDMAERFVDYAKQDTSGKSLMEIVRDFAKQDEASTSQIRKLKAALRDIESAEQIQKGGDKNASKIRSTEEIPQREVRPQVGQETPLRQSGQTPQETPSVQEVTPPIDPITGEPAKLVTEKQAKAMEKKVVLPAQKDVAKLAEQMALFDREIGEALESGGRFLPKEMRPEVAKGAPAEKATVTSKDINQYFVNKLSSVRKQMQSVRAKINQQADVESQVYFDLLQKRFEQSFKQVQELRRASHESLYFWNKIRAEYQEIARAAGQMPEMKKQTPIINQIIKDIRGKEYLNAGRHFMDYLRMNYFTPGSWTLDFGTNLIASLEKLPVWAVMDVASFIGGKPSQAILSAVRALGNGMRNWNPFGKRWRLPEQIEAGLGTTAGGEFGGAAKQVMIDFGEYLPNHPQLVKQLNNLDYVLGGAVRMKRSVDTFFGRFGAAADLYNTAYREGRLKGLTGDELKTFVEEFVANPPEAALEKAIKTGKELKFNRDLTELEERYANSTMTKLVVETYPRWTLQFARWGGELLGINPGFFKKVATGKASLEDISTYFIKAATGWGGIYAFNQLFYDNIDANSMEYVREDGDRVRLSGRTPAPELFFVCAILRGDSEKAKAALPHLSIPGARMLGGEPGGLISPLIDTIRESMRGRYTAQQTARELTKIVNDAIPGKSVLGLIRAIFDPTIREGVGAPIPGVASLLPQKANPTTGEPLAPKQRIPGTGVELPSVGGTPFPGAVRVLNDIESALLDHGLGLTRPRRISIIDLPAEDVPQSVRREYEVLVGSNVKQLLGPMVVHEDFKSLPFEVRRDVLQKLLAASRQIARSEIAEKYGTSGITIKSEPLNIRRMPERLTK